MKNGTDIFRYNDIEPAVNELTVLKIIPGTTNNAYNYKINTVRTLGIGAIQFGGITATNGYITMTGVLSGEATFNLSYLGSGDKFDIGVSILDGITNATLFETIFFSYI